MGFNSKTIFKSFEEMWFVSTVDSLLIYYRQMAANGHVATIYVVIFLANNHVRYKNTN